MSVRTRPQWRQSRQGAAELDKRSCRLLPGSVNSLKYGRRIDNGIRKSAVSRQNCSSRPMRLTPDQRSPAGTSRLRLSDQWATAPGRHCWTVNDSLSLLQTIAYFHTSHAPEIPVFFSRYRRRWPSSSTKRTDSRLPAGRRRPGRRKLSQGDEALIRLASTATPPPSLATSFSLAEILGICGRMTGVATETSTGSLAGRAMTSQPGT